VKKPLLGFLAFQLVSTFSFGLTFLEPAFNRLDPVELKALQKANPQDRLLILYFEAEALYWRGQIQASQEALNSVNSECERTPTQSLSDRKAILCYLSELGFSYEFEPLKRYFEKGKTEKVLKALQSKVFSFEERAYLEGALLWRIPEALGGNAGKSLLGWESLRRLRPDLSSADFFMGQIHLGRGRRKLAEEAFERALNHNPPDPRARLIKKPEALPMKGRFYLGVVGNPAGGTGIVIGRRDDRLLDTDRQLDVSISAQSRGVYFGRIFYQDKEALEPLWLIGRVVAASEIDQYFGMGARASAGNLTEISQARSEGSVGVRKWFSSLYGEVGLGWYLRDPSSVIGADSSNGNLRTQQKSVIPSFEVGIKDKKLFEGFLQVGVSAKGWASSHSFEVYRLGLRKDFLLTSESTLLLESQVRFLTGQKPFGMLSQVSGNLSVPGVRRGRFRENAAWYGTAEWQWAFWQDFSIGVFGTLASVGASFDSLGSGPFLSGGGAAVTIGRGNFKSRIELGRFAGETVIQTGVQIFSE